MSYIAPHPKVIRLKVSDKKCLCLGEFFVETWDHHHASEFLNFPLGRGRLEKNTHTDCHWQSGKDATSSFSLNQSTTLQKSCRKNLLSSTSVFGRTFFLGFTKCKGDKHPTKCLEYWIGKSLIWTWSCLEKLVPMYVGCMKCVHSVGEWCPFLKATFIPTTLSRIKTKIHGRNRPSFHGNLLLPPQKKHTDMVRNFPKIPDSHIITIHHAWYIYLIHDMVDFFNGVSCREKYTVRILP